MAKKTKKWLILASVLVILGAIIFGGAMMGMNWDFSKLSTAQYETQEHIPAGNYQNIAIDTDTADITFVPSEGKETKVVCYEQKNAKHAVSVADGTLTIQVKNNKKWYEYIGITFSVPKITVYLPVGEYGDLTVSSDTGRVQIPGDFSFASVDIGVSTGRIQLGASASKNMKIKTSTGDITLENLSVGALELSVSTGRITVLNADCKGDMKVKVSTGKTDLTDVKCQNFLSTGSTGGLSMENVIATGAFHIERDTGDVDFKKCDAAEIKVETDTGHIRGSLLTEKVFIAETDTGRVEVPHTASGGKCELTTDTGNIKIEIIK